MGAVWFGMTLAALDFDTAEPVDLMFRLGINEFRGETSLQMTLIDARPTVDGEAELEREKRRYAEIEAGGHFARTEDLLPSRDECGAVWRFLRREAALGHGTFPVRRLLLRLNGQGAGHFNYCKLMWILRIFDELKLCSFREPVPDTLLLSPDGSGGKKDLDSSVLLASLRARAD